jgi:hypothetical protein
MAGLFHFRASAPAATRDAREVIAALHFGEAVLPK